MAILEPIRLHFRLASMFFLLETQQTKFGLPSKYSKKVCLLEFVYRRVIFKFHADKSRLFSLNLECNHQRMKLLSVSTTIRIN